MQRAKIALMGLIGLLIIGACSTSFSPPARLGSPPAPAVQSFSP